MKAREAFFDKVVTVPECGCWLWDGTMASRGYGAIRVDNKSWRAHRYSWFVHNGPIPDGLYVCHKCDTRPCCNPDHLFLGTHADNVRDCVAKGRHVGSRQTHCKRGHEFTPENTKIRRRRPGHPARRECRTCNNEARKVLHRAAKLARRNA